MKPNQYKENNNMNRTIKSISILMSAALGLAVLSGCAAPAAPAQPASNQPSHTISVTGSGLAFGAPDIAVAQIGVQSRNPDAAAALDEANAKMTAIMGVLKELGVADKDVQTSDFSVFAQQDIDPQTGQAKGTITYVVDNTVSITMRDLTKVGQVLGQVVAAGANNIYGVSYTVSDQSKLEAEARDKAMADARARAEQLAKAAGVTLDQPMTISEYTNGPKPILRADLAQSAAGAKSVPVSSGQIQVNLQINITYLIK
jgi:uncharacterized protein YggE